MTAAQKTGARAKATTKAPARATKAKKPSKPKSVTPSKPASAKGLTALQERFALEYVKDFNATRAYQACKPHVSAKTAGVEGYRLLKNPSVQAAAQAARERIANKLELSAERTMQEIARLAYFDPRKLFDPEGNPLSLDKLDDDTAAAIAGVEVVTVGNADMGFGEVRKIKISDKNAALEKAAKILGLFKKDNEQAGNALGAALAKFVAQFHGKDSGRLRVTRD